MRFALKTALASLALMSAAPASAVIVQNADGSYTIDSTDLNDSFTVPFVGNNFSDLSATLTLTFLGLVNTDDYQFGYTLENTSSINSEVTVFGFDVSPNLAAGSSATGFFDLLASGQSAQGVDVEICFKADGPTNSCNSGQNGVADGDSGTGTLTLAFGSLNSSITLDDFFTRFQSVGADGQDSDVGRPPVVPEPSTWAMMLLGFGAIGYSLRRRRKDVLAQLA